MYLKHECKAFLIDITIQIYLDSVLSGMHTYTYIQTCTHLTLLGCGISIIGCPTSIPQKDNELSRPHHEKGSAALQSQIHDMNRQYGLADLSYIFHNLPQFFLIKSLQVYLSIPHAQISSQLQIEFAYTGNLSTPPVMFTYIIKQTQILFTPTSFIVHLLIMLLITCKHVLLPFSYLFILIQPFWLIIFQFT